LKNLTNSNSKEEIRDLTGKMGEVINQNLKKIVPQKGIVKGPYGRPLVYNPSNMPSGGQVSSGDIMVESLRHLKDSTSRFKLDTTQKSDEMLMGV
jgi:hypothetical protein